jgi:3-oxoacyl-[acyl-carrier-protein] synthase-3
MYFTYSNINIIGISCTVPKTNVEVSKTYVDTFGIEKVTKFIQTVGVNSFRKASKNTTGSDLAINSAKHLFKKFPFLVKEIGILIYVTQTPDYFLPSTSFYIHNHLEMSSKCIVFDINLGCSGYVHALNTIFSLLEKSEMSYALLLTGDTSTKVVNPEDPATAMLFGDAGSATLIEKSQIKNKTFFSFETISKNFNDIIISNGAFKKPGKPLLEMNGLEVFNFGIHDVKMSINNHITNFENEFPKYDYFVPHQANKFMINQLNKLLLFKAKPIPLFSISDYGNTSVNSIPITFSHHNQLDFNDKNIFMSGFGVGFSVANLSIKFNNIYVSEVLEYEI